MVNTTTTATIEHDAAMHVKVQQQLINRQQFVVSALMAFPLIYACTINVFMAFKRVAQTIINCIILIHHYSSSSSDALFVGVLGEMLLIMASACCLSLSKVVLPIYMRFLHHPLLFRITYYI